MILVDANLLVYSYVVNFPQHAEARAWLDHRLSGASAVGIPWTSLLAFARLVSNPRILLKPIPVPRAWRQVEEWLSCAPVWIPQPTDRHREIVARFLREPWMTSPLVPDAHLAALAIEHGLTLQSTDVDFARFPGLRFGNPLGPLREGGA